MNKARNLFYETQQGRADAPPLVFFPGWAFDGRIAERADLPFSLITPQHFLFPETVAADLHAYLAARKIRQTAVMGWSMGAFLALGFARCYPDMVSRVYLLSVRKSWPVAKIIQLEEDLGRNPREALHRFYRKCFLGLGRQFAWFEESLEPDYARATNLPLLQAGLDYLKDATASSAVTGPELWVFHGRRDVVAPLAEMPSFPNARVEIMEHAGHMPFLCPAFARFF